MRLLRPLVGVLLLISGVTHVAQLWVYPNDSTAKLAAAFGVVYFIIGLLVLLSRSGIAIWASLVFPIIGAILGVIRFLSFHANPFTEFHLFVDALVIVICVYLLATGNATRAAKTPSSVGAAR